MPMYSLFGAAVAVDGGLTVAAGLLAVAELFAQFVLALVSKMMDSARLLFGAVVFVGGGLMAAATRLSVAAKADVSVAELFA